MTEPRPDVAEPARMDRNPASEGGMPAGSGHKRRTDRAGDVETLPTIGSPDHATTVEAPQAPAKTDR